ncbi:MULTISPECIES: TonB-dependent receptor domain-containing protein [Methylomonas]|uniref:TonB-dependent receptor n=1 Tax=Methylomonas koyamae TaxID=702114 RepID=A0A177N1M4_9GAMM|nr:TonB-dependent receptor [Methylomonas koyamae]NJA05661.1 TonB-dependent receptor [Methylococcaceae bacterium WWC4]OAI11868.1 TonB-dependent receptor [Methylomonas koyamae]
MKIGLWAPAQARRTLPLLALALAASFETLADNGASRFDLPPQALAATLEQLAKSTGTKLIYADAVVQGLSAEALRGQFTIGQALEKVLSKNGLQYETVGDGMIAIKKAPPPKPKAVNDDSIFELGAVTVSDNEQNGKLTSKDIATSVDIMYADKIADQNVLTAYDLFHRMPGVQVTQFGQGITTGKMSFRGFNGEGRVNAVKLLIDGIPSNTNSGDTYFVDSLFPLDIESIEVVRGTNDARYGLHSFAGNISMNTTTGGNYVKGRVGYGSFNTHDIQSGLGYEKDGFSQNYQISYRASEGYRDHSDTDKNSFSGKWFYTPDDQKYKIGLIARWSEAGAQEPGYMTYQEQLLNQTQTFARNATDGGKRTVGQVSTHLDVNLSQTLFWSSKVYGTLFDDQRYVTYGPGAIQQERDRDEIQYGAMTSLTYHPVVSWLDDFSLETGFDFQQQENKYLRYLTDSRVRRSTGLRNDEKWDFLNYGGYIQAVIKPFKWLKLTPGYRADIIDGSFFNHRAGSTYGAYPLNDYGTISQPKIGAVITPIEGYSLYGNWGRTFQVGLGQATFILNSSQKNIGPSLNDGWEVGIKLKPVDWAEGRVAYWAQDASNEISRNLASVDSTMIGATKRQGVDIEIKVYPTDKVGVWAAYSLQEAKVTNPPAVSSAMQYVAGNQVVNTPNYLFSAGIDYQILPQLRSSLWTSGQGDYFVDQANVRGKYGEYALLNLDLGYQVTKEVEVQFQAKNLADVRREYVWYDESFGATAQPFFSPGDGIAFYGAVNVKFDY